MALWASVKFLLNINDATEKCVHGDRQEQNGLYESYVEVNGDYSFLGPDAM
jgi:hypothetical protein